MFRSEEDYLKTIYELSLEQDRLQVKTSEIAEVLGHTDQSVNEKIKKLVSKDYLIFEPYKGVSLTKQGIDEAIRMIRAHRLWEVFLMQDLGFHWTELHQDAEELEHASSKKIIESLYKHLGEPQYCKHGNPIPDLEGNTPPIALKSLVDSKDGDDFTVSRVIDKKELLLFLDGHDIGMRSKLKVISNNAFAESIDVEVDGKEVQLTHKIAKYIFDF